MPTTLAIPQPSANIDVYGVCSGVEAWAAEATDVGEIKEAMARLSMIDQYLAETNTEGRKAIAAARRRLEVRIGEVLGPASETNGRPLPRDAKVLTEHERHDFRDMAANPDVVEDVIADSTDDEPPSRRKVLGAIKERKTPSPRRNPLPDQSSTAAWNLRKAVESLQRIFADDRFDANKDQVAAHVHGHLTFTVEACQDLLDQLDHQEN